MFSNKKNKPVKTYIKKSNNGKKSSANIDFKKKTNKKNNKPTKKNNKKRGNRFRKLVLIALIIFIPYLVIKFTTNIDNEDRTVNYLSTESFIKKIEIYAKQEYQKSGILPSITIAQAILESNSGNSRLSKEGNNLFGIKAGKSWKGKKISFQTEENYREFIKAEFRKYSSWRESIDDHTKLLMQNPVYRKNGLFKTKNYKKQAQALEDAGYATAQDSKGNRVYADRLIKLIQQYNLHRYDIDMYN